MPQEDEASTQNSTDEKGGGFAKEEPQKGAESWVRHHEISVVTLGLGVRKTNGEGERLKEAAKREIAGSRERPSGSAREQ